MQIEPHRYRLRLQKDVDGIILDSDLSIFAI